MKNTKGRKAGFTLIELLIAISILALLVAVFMPEVIRAHHNDKVRRWQYYFEVKYPQSPDEVSTNRLAVVNALVSLKEKLAAAKGTMSDMAASMETAHKSTAEEIIKYADLETLLDKQSIAVAELQTQYSDALALAYDAGYEKETDILGYHRFVDGGFVE